MNLLEFSAGINIYRFIYPPVESNMYAIIDGSNCFIIDSNISDEFISILNNNGIKSAYLFLTHEHYDHSHGISWLKDNFDVTLYCNTLCSEGLSTKVRSIPRLVALVIADKDKKNGTNELKKFKDAYVDYEHKADVPFNDYKECTIGSHNIKCVHTPGHSPGSSIFILDDKFAFTGDSLIQDKKVITSFRGGDAKAFKKITLPILKNLPDDMVIMPGHGEPFLKKEFNFDIYNV